jgi:hypothetical protein
LTPIAGGVREHLIGVIANCFGGQIARASSRDHLGGNYASFQICERRDSLGRGGKFGGPIREEQSHPAARQDEMKPPRQEEAKPPKEERKEANQEQKEENRQGREMAPGQPQGHAGPARKSAHIPEEKFHAQFGREHHFAVRRPIIVEGAPGFFYGGYSFVLVDPWPAEWTYDDDCYVDYIDGEYFLFNVRHPGVRIALMVVE